MPATIAIIGGRLKAGLTPEEIDYLGKSGHAVTKASRRDLPVLVAKGMDGACTVTTTMMIAAMAGIKVFATGGIGGVHRGAETTMDISADLEELAKTPVLVVCAGAKAILDLGLTLEYLETKGCYCYRLRHQGAARLLYPQVRLRRGLRDRYPPGSGQGLPCEAGAGPGGRPACDEPHSRGVFHGSRRY